MCPSGPRRLRQLVGDHVGNLAETAMPSVEVETRRKLRQDVVECIHYGLSQTHAKHLLQIRRSEVIIKKALQECNHVQ